LRTSDETAAPLETLLFFTPTPAVSGTRYASRNIRRTADLSTARSADEVAARKARKWDSEERGEERGARGKGERKGTSLNLDEDCTI
jgi:hypothetical protein